MKIISIAFIISLLIHLLIFIDYKKEIQKKEEKKEHIEKSDIKFVKLKQEKVIEQEIEKKVEEVKSPPIIKQPEPIQKQTEIKKEVKQEKSNNIKKTEAKKEINLKEAKQNQKDILKESSKFQEKTLEDFLSQKSLINKEVLNELQELYGKEYDNFTKVQKAYLEKNLNNFQVITQKVLNRLGYPKLAAKLRIGGINIVEFMFHPNGNISDLKIIGPSGYTILDDYTLELIEIAYKEYPKPTEPTKLRFRVFYRIY